MFRWVCLGGFWFFLGVWGCYFDLRFCCWFGWFWVVGCDAVLGGFDLVIGTVGLPGSPGGFVFSCFDLHFCGLLTETCVNFMIWLRWGVGVIYVFGLVCWGWVGCVWVGDVALLLWVGIFDFVVALCFLAYLILGVNVVWYYFGLWFGSCFVGSIWVWVFCLSWVGLGYCLGWWW